MIKTVGFLAVLASTLLAAPAFAQPGTQDPETAAIDDELPPAVGPATVIIVTPQQSRQQVVRQPVGGPGMAPPAADAAPQNEPWSNVSHINGQPVKVGERGDYLYKWRSTNIATNPVGWMFGFYGVSVSHAVHDNVAIRADANLISIDHVAGYEIGVSLPIYLRRVFSGPFLEVGLVARKLSDTADCEDCGQPDASVGPEALFGWHWTFDSGFNVAMAFGAMRNLSSSSSGGNPEPVGYFRIGYAM